MTKRDPNLIAEELGKCRDRQRHLREELKVQRKKDKKLCEELFQSMRSEK